MRERERVKRERVMRSRAFHDWWGAREHEDPHPSNPYQAYMIDLSLKAVIHGRRAWEQVPNRRDLPNVDFPFGSAPNWAPAPKNPRRQERPYKSPELPRDKLSRELTLKAEAMAIHYGQPAPTVHIESEGVLRSYARTGVGQRYTGEIIRVGGGTVHIGGRGRKLTPQMEAAAYHEIGHVVHAQSLFRTDTSLAGVKPYSAKHHDYADEQAAWKLAQPFIDKMPSKGARPQANWLKAYALNTYRQGAALRGKPVKVNRQGQIIGGA